MKTLICAVTVLAVSTAGADTIYVDGDAPLGGDGVRWGTAYRFLQDALANAVAGTEIRVAQGVYETDRHEANPDPPSASDCCFSHFYAGCDAPVCQATVCAVDPSCCKNNYWTYACAELASTMCGLCPDRTATFQLISGVVLIGGFAGIGTPNPDDRDIALYETVLSGDLLGNDDPDNLPDTTDDNSFHVVTTSGVDATTVLDGCTITAGSNPSGSVGGGGILNDSGSPTIMNCTITGNSGGYDGGGGMFNIDSSPTITNCTFTGNRSADDGGGMFNSNSTLTVTNSTFSDNRTFSHGGGIANVGLSNVTFTNCTISRNRSSHKTGGMYNRDSTVSVTNCVFEDNIAGKGNGGGMSIIGGSATVANCTFIGNLTSDSGGGMYNSGGRTTVTNCTFTGNVADYGVGGGMRNSGGSPMVSGCTFSGNSGGYGSGMSNGGGVTAINCTFTGNLGWGMWNSFGTATVVNCTFIGNQDGGVANYASTTRVINCILWGNGPDEVLDQGIATTVSYSDVRGGYAGTGNIDVDPLFIDADGPDDIPGTEDDDLRLQPGSPCINAGNNWGTAPDVADLDADGDTTELTPLDFDGNPRFADLGTIAGTGCGVQAIVDMGAYELQGQPALDPVYFGDLNGDGVVNMADLMVLNGCIGSIAGNCCIADLNFDGEIGMSDRAVLLAELIETAGGTGDGPPQPMSICEVAHVAASDAIGTFGQTVAVSGDTALITAPAFIGGSVYVFVFDGTTWVETQQLVPADGTGDGFGHSLAMDGQLAVIGAKGSAYVFLNNGSSWVEVQKLIPSDEALGFGEAVSLDGDVAVIGAPSGSSSAYVFRRSPFKQPSGSQWLQEQKLLPSDGDYFGGTVAVAGDVALIGARGVYDDGSVYVFRFDGTGWVQEQQLLGPFSNFARFSLSMSGDAILVGADVGGLGAAHVFRFDPLGAPGSQWVAEQTLFASDFLLARNFGRSVALDGDIAVIGAPTSNVVGDSHGAAYVFRRNDDGGWMQRQRLFPDTGDSYVYFGLSVALDGDIAVIGARFEQPTGAYMYAGLTGVNCNANGRSDVCDILDGTSDDANGNGIPDECECVWDIDGDTNVGVTDLLDLLSRRRTDPGAPPDIDGNATVDVADVLELLANWGPCP